MVQSKATARAFGLVVLGKLNKLNVLVGRYEWSLQCGNCVS